MNTIQAAWDSYSTNVIPKDASSIQIRETKRSFYMGASALLEIQFNIGDETISEDAAQHILEGVCDEIETLLIDVQQGRA